MTPPAVTSDEISTGLPGRGDATPPILARTDRKTDTRRAQPVTGRGSTHDDILTPTLRAPSAPVSGDTVSGLEEVPATLRASGRAAVVSSGELTNRRATRTMRDPAVHEGVETTAPPTAEEAFSVRTPGGGVLGGGQEPSGYTAEEQAQVRATG